jgi:hypothetical protein
VAVVVDGWVVVARRTVVEATLPEGLAGWSAVVPNRMACADRDLCVVAFMEHQDASAFVVKLESIGLRSERDGEYRDVAIVGTDGAWEHRCAWLQHGRYAGVHAVWLTDSDPEPLVVPLGWRPNSLINLSPEQAAKRLKFLRRDGAVEVWLDTESGKELFRARSSPHELEPEIEERFRAATKAVQPLITFDGPQRRLGWFERRRLANAIRELETLATGDRWRVWFFLGMARRAASDPAGAYDAFEHAYAANPAHADISREFGGQCLALGRGAEAVAVCERACTIHPRDAGLRANLALACVVADDLPRATLEVKRALEMDPADKVTRALATAIDEVIAGKRPRITKYP